MTSSAGQYYLPLMLALLAPVTAVAQNDKAKTQKITVVHAVANSKSEGGQPREIALKDKFAESCDGRETCTTDAQLPGPQFSIEVTYSCRDSSGSSRQMGPLKFDGMQVIELNCK